MAAVVLAECVMHTCTLKTIGMLPLCLPLSLLDSCCKAAVLGCEGQEAYLGCCFVPACPAQ